MLQAVSGGLKVSFEKGTILASGQKVCEVICPQPVQVQQLSSLWFVSGHVLRQPPTDAALRISAEASYELIKTP